MVSSVISSVRWGRAAGTGLGCGPRAEPAAAPSSWTTFLGSPVPQVGLRAPRRRAPRYGPRAVPLQRSCPASRPDRGGRNHLGEPASRRWLEEPAQPVRRGSRGETLVQPRRRSPPGRVAAGPSRRGSRPRSRFPEGVLRRRGGGTRSAGSHPRGRRGPACGTPGRCTVGPRQPCRRRTRMRSRASRGRRREGARRWERRFPRAGRPRSACPMRVGAVWRSPAACRIPAAPQPSPRTGRGGVFRASAALCPALPPRLVPLFTRSGSRRGGTSVISTARGIERARGFYVLIRSLGRHGAAGSEGGEPARRSARPCAARQPPV